MILAFMVAAGVVLTSVQVLVVVMRRRAVILHHELPFVSILKPVCGLDDELEANLLSFVSLVGIRYEVILSIENRQDPAMPLLASMVRDHPDVFRLVVGGRRNTRVANRKVERLLVAAEVARGEIFLISDSNVRVQPDDVARTLAAFDTPETGCVSNLFVGAGASDAGAALESLHLMMFVAPGAAAAAAAGVPCVVGKSMAIRREVLRAIGGFEAFVHLLAEDQAIGLAVKKAGFEVAVSPVVVRNVVVHRTMQRALDRQIRWNKIRYAFSRSTFAAEILLNPLPFALFLSPSVAAAVLGIRYAQALALRIATVSDLRLRQLAILPLLDLLMLYAWIVPFFSNRIIWRGYEARIGRGTELLPAPV